MRPKDFFLRDASADKSQVFRKAFWKKPPHLDKFKFGGHSVSRRRTKFRGHSVRKLLAKLEFIRLITQSLGHVRNVPGASFLTPGRILTPLECNEQNPDQLLSQHRVDADCRQACHYMVFHIACCRLMICRTRRHAECITEA